MTIAVRLSRTLHVALGEDGAADMVNWMHGVDDHRAALRELNGLTAARLDARFGEFEARFNELDARLGEFEARFGGKLDRLRAELIKWTFLFWCGTMAIVLLGRR